MWDDDDVYLASHVSSLVAKLRDGEPAARLQGMLTWDGVKMGERGGSTNAAHTALFRRAAYGTWPIAFDRNADSGCADNEFWQRAMNGGWFVGRHHHEPDGILSCILRMDPGRDRASDSERGLCTSQHVRDLWCARVYNGEEPKGAVEIVPAWSRNWQIVADEYKAST
jgi:hypothetical protein